MPAQLGRGPSNTADIGVAGTRGGQTLQMLPRLGRATGQTLQMSAQLGLPESSQGGFRVLG